MTSAIRRLRAFASRLVDPYALTRVIDPLLTDLQLEYNAAIRHGRVWRARWTLAAGHMAFAKTIVLCQRPRMMSFFEGWSTDDRTSVTRAVCWSLVAMVAVTVLLEALALWRLSSYRDPMFIVYLLPSQFVIALPMGVTFGLCLGLRGRTRSRRSTMALVLFAMVCVLVGFTTMSWGLPAANDAFRRRAFVQMPAVNRQYQSMAPKGPPELTLRELTQRIKEYRHDGVTGRDLSGVLYAYHLRWALSFASLALPLCGLLTGSHRPAWVVPTLTACGLCFAYYLLLLTGRELALRETLPAFAGAWLANAICAVTCAALMANSRRPLRANLR